MQQTGISLSGSTSSQYQLSWSTSISLRCACSGSFGLDENGSPVIFEYKRSVNENVINQGLFYLDWLLDHRAEFELLVMKRFGHDAAGQIDWSSPRLVCVASDFTRYDEHAIAQINRSIELVRYRDYDGAFLTLDLMASTSASATSAEGQEGPARAPAGDRTVTQLLVYLKTDPKSIALEPGFTRDMTKIGHFGTGDLEVAIGNHGDFERAQQLITASYQAS
jgi:hypothetical protein